MEFIFKIREKLFEFYKTTFSEIFKPQTYCYEEFPIQFCTMPLLLKWTNGGDFDIYLVYHIVNQKV